MRRTGKAIEPDREKMRVSRVAWDMPAPTVMLEEVADMVDEKKDRPSEQEAANVEAEPKRKGEQEIREAARIEDERRRKEYGEEKEE